MKKLSIIIALSLILGGKAFAQYEVEDIFDSLKNETPCSLFHDIIEFDNCVFILNGSDMASFGINNLNTITL